MTFLPNIQTILCSLTYPQRCPATLLPHLRYQRYQSLSLAAIFTSPLETVRAIRRVMLSSCSCQSPSAQASTYFFTFPHVQTQKHVTVSLTALKGEASPCGLQQGWETRSDSAHHAHSASHSSYLSSWTELFDRQGNWGIGRKAQQASKVDRWI